MGRMEAAMNRFTAIALIGISALALSACGGSGSSSASRDYIRAVGSSTVYPFATAVAEIQIGIDGIDFAEAAEGANIKLTPEVVYKALLRRS